jgi:hypothetical protein
VFSVSQPSWQLLLSSQQSVSDSRPIGVGQRVVNPTNLRPLMKSVRLRISKGRFSPVPEQTRCPKPLSLSRAIGMFAICRLNAGILQNCRARLRILASRRALTAQVSKLYFRRGHMISRTLLISLGFASAAGSLPLAATTFQNVVPNPDFSGSANGWAKQGTSSPTGVFAWDGTDGSPALGSAHISDATMKRQHSRPDHCVYRNH